MHMPQTTITIETKTGGGITISLNKQTVEYYQKHILGNIIYMYVDIPLHPWDKKPKTLQYMYFIHSIGTQREHLYVYTMP